jgi:hypothetical protein
MEKNRFSLVLLVFLIWLSLTGFQSLPQQTYNPLLISPFLLRPSIITAPSPFGKQLPIDGAVNQPTSNLTLQWVASSPNVTYQYCLRQNKQTCPPPKWISVGVNTSVTLQGLTPNAKYYWQVRAVDSSNNYTYADNNKWWQFNTIQNPSLPGPFNKLTPADAQTDQPVISLALTWSTSSLATSYQYCYDTVNNNTCDTSWISVSGLSASVSGLSYDTTYYWQVRAVNASGNVEADYGTWFSFHTQLAPPGAFGKTSPANYAVEQPLNLTLSWGASTGTGIIYEYCIGTTPCTSASAWIPAGTSLSVSPSSLQYETTYYWQIRAVNTTATIYANSGFSWSFSTPIAPPQNFGKTSPGNNLTNQPLSLILAWGTSTGTNIHYEYCINIAACTPASTWLLAGANTSANISGLSYATTYYWQVRAVNVTSTIYADGGTLWQFTTQTAPPQTFIKLRPAKDSPDKVPSNLTLQWSPSTGASSYHFCVDTTSHPDHDSNCGTGWVLNATTESIHLSLNYNQTYYWQVYAQNSQGILQADNGVWWSFTTIASAPSSFTKISPLDGVIDQQLNPWLYWWTPNPENTFQYCIGTSTVCPSGGWTIIAGNAPIEISTPLLHNTTYYWQVCATSGGICTVSANDAWWSFTTLKAPPTSSDQSFSTDENMPLNKTLTADSNYGKYFELYGSPPAGTLDFHSDGSFTYIPVAYFDGAITFQFVVSDGHNAPVGPYTVTITVNPVNNPPTLSSIPDQVIDSGNQVTFWAQATDPDLPYGEHLTYSIDEALPSGASMDSGTGFFNWPVPADQGSGVFNFTVRVTDSGGLSASQMVKITVVAHRKIYIPIIFH